MSSIEIIQNPTYSVRRAYDLIKSGEEEVLRIFSSIPAFRRQVRLGIMHLFKDAVERGVRVRILIPADHNEVIQIVNEVNLVLPQLDMRSVDKSLQSTVGILVVDRKESLIIETKDGIEGLGLYICKSIIEAHGGKIWAENNNIHGENGVYVYIYITINK
jgi:hypothetical protein